MSTGRSRFVVVTGGPGSGKSTLLDHLDEVGYTRSQEVGRAIIRDQSAIGGRALPWVDPELFAELMLCQEMHSYRRASSGAAPGSVVFFDRGVPDVVGYLRVQGRPVPPHVDTAAREYRYQRRVFVAPVWPEIYATDTERKQSLAQARETHDAMVATYREYGYELVALPCSPVEQRARFVLDAVT